MASDNTGEATGTDQRVTQSIEQVAAEERHPDKLKLGANQIYSALTPAESRQRTPENNGWSAVFAYSLLGVLVIGGVEWVTGMPTWIFWQAIQLMPLADRGIDAFLSTDSTLLSIETYSIQYYKNNLIYFVLDGTVVVILGIICGFIAMVLAPLRNEQPIAEDGVTYTLATSGIDAERLTASISTTGPVDTVEDAFATAHENTIQWGARTRGDNNTLPAAVQDVLAGTADDVEAVTLQVHSSAECPRDGYQQGTSVNEALTAGDPGLPVDSIARIVAAATQPLVVRITVHPLLAGEAQRERYKDKQKFAASFSDLRCQISTIGNRDLELASTRKNTDGMTSAAETRCENLDEAESSYFRVSVTAIAVIDSDTTGGEQAKIRATLKQVTNAVGPMFPPFVKPVAKLNSTVATNPVEKLRARRAIRDFSRYRCRSDWISLLAYLGYRDDQQPNLVVDTAELGNLVAIPGSGRPASQRGYTVVPPEQLPPKRPSPKKQDRIRGDSYPETQTNHDEQSTDETDSDQQSSDEAGDDSGGD